MDCENYGGTLDASLKMRLSFSIAYSHCRLSVGIGFDFDFVLYIIFSPMAISLGFVLTDWQATMDTT